MKLKGLGNLGELEEDVVQRTGEGQVEAFKKNRNLFEKTDQEQKCPWLLIEVEKDTEIHTKM